MQRARERSYNEKLKARYEGRAHKRNCEPDTLLPALEASSRSVFLTDPEPVFSKCLDSDLEAKNVTVFKHMI
jgi:hypothetical protein